MKRSLFWLYLGVGVSVLICGCARLSSTERDALRNVLDDHQHFYSARNLGFVAVGLGASAGLAHTDADQEIREWYQDEVRAASTDEIARWVKPLGNGRYSVPILVGTVVLLNMIGEQTPLEAVTLRWAGHSLRTFLVGVPPMLLLQRATGASRPGEGASEWHPFKDDNGVSGHSFMGAAPFLAAARMTDSTPLKGVFYLGSTLCGVSRLNDDKHYFSQVLAGWWLAYSAAKSVQRTQERERRFSVAPLIADEVIGLQLHGKF